MSVPVAPAAKCAVLAGGDYWNVTSYGSLHCHLAAAVTVTFVFTPLAAIPVAAIKDWRRELVDFSRPSLM